MSGCGGGGDLEAFLVSQARMPGYTGFRPGVRAVNAKTPAVAQLSASAAASTTPRANAASLSTSSATTNTTTTNTTTTTNPHHLFPLLQAPGPQPSARKDEAAATGAAPGGLDVDDATGRGAACRSARSTAAEAFAAPSAAFARVRSPMRNKELERLSLGVEGPTPASSAALLSRYASAQSRVGPAALRATLARMRQRLLAKVTSTGDNAFRLRRLFRAYDAAGTGRVALEDFRAMGEAFGLQLGDDVLLSLFGAWDPLGTGSLAYEPLVATMLGDADAFAMYAPERAAADNAQASADARLAAGVARELAASARGGAAAVRRVLGAMAGSGGHGGGSTSMPAAPLLPWAGFVASMASVGVALSPQQQAFVCDARHGFVPGGGGSGGGGGGGGGSVGGEGAMVVDWGRFCDALDRA